MLQSSLYNPIHLQLPGLKISLHYEYEINEIYSGVQNILESILDEFVPQMGCYCLY